MKQKTALILIKGTLLSILVFLSISFIMVLYRISPITMGNTYQLEIGFPFRYYRQFQVNGNSFLNSGWNINHLILDCVLTWGVVTGIYFLAKGRKPEESS